MDKDTERKRKRDMRLGRWKEKEETEGKLGGKEAIDEEMGKKIDIEDREWGAGKCVDWDDSNSQSFGYTV